MLGLTASQASASYSAKVVGTSLQVQGDRASDELLLRLDVNDPGILVLEVNGNSDLRFDRTAFTSVDVDAGGGDDRITVSRSAGRFSTSS